MNTPKQDTPASRAEHQEEQIDEGLDESFPASDPLAIQTDAHAMQRDAPPPQEPPAKPTR
jgi:hypothetical protein